MVIDARVKESLAFLGGVAVGIFVGMLVVSMAMNMVFMEVGSW